MPGKRRLIHKTELKKLRDQGKTIAECAEHFGCSKRTINNRLKKFGLLQQPAYEFDLDTIRKLYEDAGMTCVEIAALYDCHPDTIWNRVKDMGIQRRQARRDDHYLGPDSPVWRGGIRILDGYLRIRWHGKDEPLHRIVAREIMGYDLGPDDHVHHMDENPMNNDPSNLLVCTNSEHPKLHAAMRTNPDLDQRKWLREYREQQDIAA